jgi:hypothetical protein
VKQFAASHEEAPLTRPIFALAAFLFAAAAAFPQAHSGEMRLSPSEYKFPEEPNPGTGSAGVAGVAMRQPIEVGTRHGIYVLDERGRVYSFLQKPTPGQPQIQLLQVTLH